MEKKEDEKTEGRTKRFSQKKETANFTRRKNCFLCVGSEKLALLVGITCIDGLAGRGIEEDSCLFIQVVLIKLLDLSLVSSSLRCLRIPPSSSFASLHFPFSYHQGCNLPKGIFRYRIFFSHPLFSYYYTRTLRSYMVGL